MTRRRWIERAGPILLLPAIFLFAYAVAWRLSAPRRVLPAGAGELSDATSHGAPEDVGGFVGRQEVPGGVLLARLVPLQSAADWEAFDRAALARRLGEDVGEPWRLELRFEASPHEPALALGDVVVDAGGVLLEQIEPPSADGTGGPFDPVRVLLARRAADLAPGASIELVVCGGTSFDERIDGARVSIARDAADGGPLSLALEPARVATVELARSIARAQDGDEDDGDDVGDMDDMDGARR